MLSVSDRSQSLDVCTSLGAAIPVAPPFGTRCSQGSSAYFVSVLIPSTCIFLFVGEGYGMAASQNTGTFSATR